MSWVNGLFDPEVQEINFKAFYKICKSVTLNSRQLITSDQGHDFRNSFKQTSIFCKMFVLMLYVPVNDFSVTSGCFLG